MATTNSDIRLNKKTWLRLKELGKIRDRSSSYLIKVAIARYLDAEEAQEAERQLTLTRWAKFELTGETIDHSHIKDWANDLDANT